MKATSHVHGPVQPTHTQTGAPAGTLSRRAFMVRSAVGGGLMLGFAMPGLDVSGAGSAQAQTGGSDLTAWIIVGTDEKVTVQVPITEMGQGTMTGLATLVADQLKVAWSQVRVQHAPADAAHGGANANVYNFRFTGANR